LHEYGHCIAGACTGRSPHFRDPFEPDWHMCLQCELEAWQAACDLIPFTRAMHRRLQSSLDIYREKTPGTAAAIEAVDRLADFRTGFFEPREAREAMQQKYELAAQWITETRRELAQVRGR
jgi:hypothetical protein